VYSAVYKDFCGGQPIQEFFYAALITFDLLTSAGQFLPDTASSSSSAPGSTTKVVTRDMLRGGGVPSSAAGKASAVAKAVAAALASPPVSPETKLTEKRKLKAMSELAESKAKTAKMAELESKEKLLERREAEFEKMDDTPSKDVMRRRLVSMKEGIRKLEAQVWDLEEDL
jgi:hypothetical protein